MAESRSVTAILSAKDNGMTSTMKKALGTTESLASKIKNGFAFGAIAGAGQKAFGAIQSSVSSLISEMNDSSATWKTFTGNMQMIGKSKKEIASTKKELQTFAEQTVYSSSDMASTFSQLEAVGVKNTTQLVKGFGGLAAAADNPKQAMKTLSTQATQMAAKPTVAWEDFKLMLEQSPAGVAAVAKSMKMSTAQLVKNVQAQTVKTEDFLDAIAKVGTNKSFTKLATQYKTVGQAMDGLQETVANKMSPAFNVLSQEGIKAVEAITSKFDSLDANKIASGLKSGIKTIKQFVKVAQNSFKGVGTAVGQAASAVGQALGITNVKLSKTDALKGFGNACKSVANAIKSFAGFVQQNADKIAAVAPKVLKLVVAFKGFSIVKNCIPGVQGLTKAVGALAGKGISAIAGKLFGISSAAKNVGSSTVTSAQQIMTAAKSFAVMGLAVLTIAAAFGILAMSAVQVANAGPAAVAVLFGLIGAIAGLGIGIGVLLKTLAPMAEQLMPVATAMLAVGASVLLISTGFLILTTAAINLANAGPLAIACMVGIVAAIAGLAVGAAALGPALTAGAAGFIAFGAGIALVGVGALLAATALTMVAGVLPTVVEYGVSGAASIAVLGASMVVFAAGAALAGAAAIVLGAGLLVAAAGLIVAGAGALVAAAGVTVLAAGMTLLAGSLTLATASLTMVAAALPLAAAGALVCVAGFTVLTAGTIALTASLLLLNAPLLALVATAAAAGAGLLVFAAGMLAAGAGTVVMGAALTLVNSSMQKIADNAEKTRSALSNMEQSVSLVKSGLNALGDMAKSAMAKLKEALTGGGVVEDARSAGQQVGTAFSQGLTPGLALATANITVVTAAVVAALKKAASDAQATGSEMGRGFSTKMSAGLLLSTALAKVAVVAVIAALKSGKAGAYSSGAYISEGFAQGMTSKLGQIEAAAQRMVQAADKAVRAEAKIHSPSRRFKTNGMYIATGLGIGIANYMYKAVQASKKMAKEVCKAFKGAVKNGNYEKLGESLAKRFSSGMKSRKSSTTSAVKDLINNSIEKLNNQNNKKLSYYKKGTSAYKAVQSKNKALAKSYKKTGNKLYDQFKKQFENQISKATSTVENKLKSLGEKYQEKYDAIIDARKTFRDNLRSVDLYSEDNNGRVVFTNFKAEAKKMKSYGSQLEKLKKKVPSGILNEIIGMDTDSGMKFAGALLKMNSKDLKNYVSGWKQFQSATSSVSNNYYKTQLSNLQKNFNADINKTMKDFNKKMESIGKDAMRGVVKGMNSQRKNLDSAGKQLSNVIIQSFRKKLKIHSPSRVMVGLMHYVGAGAINGLKDMTGKVSQAAQNLMQIPHVETPKLAYAYDGGLSADYDYQTSAEFKVEVPLYVDGKKFARATAKYTKAEVDRQQTQSDRKIGRI